MKNNKSVLIIIGLAMSIVFSGCEIDNYDEPNVVLSGDIIYNGEPLNLSHNEVVLQVWEEGWEKEIPIYANVNQEGGFSVLTFKGNYELRFASGQGPFRPNQESISVDLNGDKVINYEVTPYYLVRNANFTINGRDVMVTFSAEKILTEADNSIQNVFLYISKTSFVDQRTSIATASLQGANITDLNSISLNVNVPELSPLQNYVFARVGIKISGVEDMIFSDIVKLNL